MASRTVGGGTVLASGIRTRERKERKLYSDDWALGDEEIEGHHTFDLEEKIHTEKFNTCFVKDMANIEFNLGYLQRNGFNWPLLFKDKNKLGITIPDSRFTINDIRLCVGSRRMLDVMDVNTQKNVEMTMKDWQRYYESKDKDKLLNVISLEFSHTKLETLVQAPTVVRQIDWVEKVWPRHLKEAQTEATNVLEDMMYPKVQKYCLMSVKGCYTDFHIDFGGTSVWYHVVKGRKIFWLIPPTERNLQLYEQWVLSGKQGDIFFGDTVDKCARVTLTEGNTFFIPTGWIHAVYTPIDSLVFGGNFLHSFGIEKQLRVAQVEDATHVPQKFRYPFFTEMLWYVLERYVHVLLGRTHLNLPPAEKERYIKYLRNKEKSNNNNQVKQEDGTTEPVPIEEEPHIHLTQYELHGLKAIVMFLHSLPTSKKYVPDLITDPIALIRDVRTVVEKHRYDKADLAITSKPVLVWWARESQKFGVKRVLGEGGMGGLRKRRQSSDENRTIGLPPNAAKIRHRRVRCKICESCKREDCRQCAFCQDMVKYGGPGTMKQTCKMKKCTQPVLPVVAACYTCGLDGWGRPITTPPHKMPLDVPSSLMECCICYKITHTKCIKGKFEGFEGVVNEDMCNSWECPECVREGYNKEYKHNRVPSSRASMAGSDVGSEPKTPQILSEAEDGDVKVKLEVVENGLKAKGAETLKAKEEVNSGDPAPMRVPTWAELQARVSRPLVQPTWVVRPAPPPQEEEEEEEEEEDDSGSDGESRPPQKEPQHPTTNRSIMLRVFKYLSVPDLLAVMRVCRSWAQWAIHHTLWPSLDLSHKTLSKQHLEGIVRRQPASLKLDWAHMSPEQLMWLIVRLPQLEDLSLQGLRWGQVCCLTSAYTPPLTKLDLSFCEGITDATLTALLSPPHSHRPGHRSTSTRLASLTQLHLGGTEVGDEGVRAIVRCLPFLTSLNLSGCIRITETTAALLAHSSSLVSHSLASLDLRGCPRLAPTCLPFLVRLPLLKELFLHPCSRIPLKALLHWGKAHGYTADADNKLSRIPPPPPDPSAEAESEVSEEASSPPASPKPQETVSKEEKSATSNEKNENKQVESSSDNNKVKKESSLNPIVTDSTDGKEKVSDKQSSVTRDEKDNEKKGTGSSKASKGAVTSQTEAMTSELSAKTSTKSEPVKKSSVEVSSKLTENTVKTGARTRGKTTSCEGMSNSKSVLPPNKESSESSKHTKDDKTEETSKKEEERGKKEEMKKEESNKKEKEEGVKREERKSKDGKPKHEERKKDEEGARKEEKVKKDDQLEKSLKTSSPAGQISRVSTRRQSHAMEGEHSKQEATSSNSVPELNRRRSAEKRNVGTSSNSSGNSSSDSNGGLSSSVDTNNGGGGSSKETKENSTGVLGKQQSESSNKCQKNIIVTAEVHQEESGTKPIRPERNRKEDNESSSKKADRRQSSRLSRDEKDDRKEDQESRSSSDSQKEKTLRKDHRAKSEDMDLITVESTDSSRGSDTNKQSEKKGPTKKEKEVISKTKEKRFMADKDICTRSSKKLKEEKEEGKEAVEKLPIRIKEEVVEETKKYPKRGKEVKEEKEEKRSKALIKDERKSIEESDDTKLSSQLSPLKRETASTIKGNSEKKEEEKSLRRSRTEPEREYLSKLRKKSVDFDKPNELGSYEMEKPSENIKEEVKEEVIRPRRRSTKDEDMPTENKGTPTRDPVPQRGEDTEDTRSTVKRKMEEKGEAGHSKKMKEESEEVAGNSKGVKKGKEVIRERSGSRERPERAHRSPRRLSMCQ